MGILRMKPGDWHIAPNEIHDNEEATPLARIVFSYVARYAVRYDSVFPSYAKIKRNTGIKSDTTVNKVMKELSALGLVQIEERYGADGKRLSNIYHVIMPGAANDPDMEPIMDILNLAAKTKDKEKIAEAAQYLQQLFNVDVKKPETDDTTPDAVPAAANEPKTEQSSDSEEKEPIAENGQMKYGHHRYVYLTDEEYKRLIDDYGANTAVAFIDQLDSRIASEGGPEKCKYIGNYATVRRWIKKDYENRQGRSSWEKDETHRRIMGNNPTEPYYDHTLEPFENDP